jgi:hypothetical protein
VSTWASRAGQRGIDSPEGSGAALLGRRLGGCGGVRAAATMGMATTMILDFWEETVRSRLVEKINYRSGVVCSIKHEGVVEHWIF